MQLDTENLELAIKDWINLLSGNPNINNEEEGFRSYVQFINSQMGGEDKGRDLGLCAFIGYSCHGAKITNNNIMQFNWVMSEANNRMQAHLLYLKNAHQLGWYNEEDAQDPRPALTKMCQEVIRQRPENTAFPVPDDCALIDIGIKCVEYIADFILE